MLWLKFQNISAILYEENLPYCDGLKPRFNYQDLLRLIVLDHLHKSPLPVEEPYQILFRKLGELRRRGYLPVEGSGSGRFGLAVEHHLGIAQNSDKGADFMGVELKTKTDASLQTLFSRVPTRYIGCQDKRGLVQEHGYKDTKRSRTALYTSFSSAGDSLGFRLCVEGDVVAVLKGDIRLLEYDAEVIESALLSKHSQTAYIALSKKRLGGNQCFKVSSAIYCKWPSIIRFLKLVSQGEVYLDFTLSLIGERIKDHGFLWRTHRTR